MSYFAKVVNNKVVVVIKAEQDFIDIYDDGTGEGEWIQTSYNTFGGKHYGRDGIEDDKPQLRYNYAGVGFTYDKEKDAFISPPMHPSFVLNETTMRYEPPIPYPTGKKGGPRRFIWDEENVNWLDMWDTSDALSQHNPDSKYFLEDVIKYEDPDYPFEDYPERY